MRSKSCSTADAVQLVRATLLASNDLRRPPYRGDPNPYTGHCYVASEAVRELADEPLKPCTVRHAGTVHWYLASPTGEIVDPTADQFSSPPPYAAGCGRGFLTARPSKRAQELLRRIA
jgi:hypothetical protein